MKNFSHFIYPLDLRPESNWAATFETIGGRREFLVRPENLVKKNIRGEIFAEWGIGQCFRTVSLGDYVWIYAGWNVRRILAVGRVERLPEPTVGNSKYKNYSHPYALVIRINNPQTLRLQKDGSRIAYDQFREWVPGAMKKANPKTCALLNKWLKKKPYGQQDHDDEVFKIRREVLQRTGQAKFRELIRSAYVDTCAITGVSEPSALVAAHIRPVKNRGRHTVKNGLFLRADVHNLFDSGLISVDRTFRIFISSLVRDDNYRKYHGKKIKLPSSRRDWPDSDALDEHFKTMFVR